MRSASVLLLVIASAGSVFAQGKTTGINAEEREVRKAADSFIEAFKNLDWERFRSFFAADATMFFPAGVLRRADGKDEAEAGFKAVFEEARKRRSGPPYLNIQPKDLKVQTVGDVAVMTFHLEGQTAVGRRTIIWRKQKGKWLIVHLHASGVMLPKEDKGVAR